MSLVTSAVAYTLSYRPGESQELILILGQKRLAYPVY